MGLSIPRLEALSHQTVAPRILHIAASTSKRPAVRSKRNNPAGIRCFTERKYSRSIFCPNVTTLPKGQSHQGQRVDRSDQNRALLIATQESMLSFMNQCRSNPY